MKNLVSLLLGITVLSMACSSLRNSFIPTSEKCLYSRIAVQDNAYAEYYICDMDKDGIIDFIYTNPRIGECAQKEHYRNLDKEECSIPEQVWQMAQDKYNLLFKRGREI